MTVLQVSKLKIGDKFLYKNQFATITWVRPPYPDDVSIVNGKSINFPDKSICFSFNVSETGEEVCLSTMSNATMVVGGKIYPLDLKDYTAI